MHYSRAYVDREATEAGKPITFVAATEGRKADNIDLRMSGARLDRFRSNPVFGYGHRYYGRQDLPIGRAISTEIDGSLLRIAVEFDQGDEFAREVERKYRDGYMNAVSIGFDVAKWEGNNGSYWSGGVAEEWELNELSAVPIPMDGDAIVTGGRTRGLDLRELLADIPADASVEVMFDELYRSVKVSHELVRGADPLTLSLYIARALTTAQVPAEPAPEPKPDPDPVVPERAADIDAARGLLAVLTEKE